MNKQIEEMAKSMCRNYGTRVCASCDAHATCMIHLYAVDVYNAGYRKYSEGEWVYNTDDFTPKQRCTVCGYNKPIVAGESVIQEPKHFCPNCGAKMKGGEE